MDKATIASMIDHTLLKAEATPEQIREVCKVAKEYHTASVCVNSVNVYTASRELRDSGVKTCTVVGFPLGAMSSAAKAFEAACALEDGAEEVDMVINIGAAKAEDWRRVEDDIATVLDACNEQAILKVIIETCLLTDEEKVEACKAAKAAGAHFVKTSTGFSSGGATVEDIRLMRATVGSEIGVKASGGIRDYETAVAMIEAGATRIGTSNTAKILE